jgi:hypothetical protein
MELRNFYLSPNVIRMIKPRRTEWAGHVVCMGLKEECIEDFVGKTRRKQTTRKS